MYVPRLVSVLVIAVIVGGSASAQSRFARTQTPPRPIISPYLNLTRTGNSQAFNYLTLVRPELRFLETDAELRKSLGALSQDTAAAVAGLEGELTTGHAFGFMTHNRYFMTISAGRAGFGTLSQPAVNRAATPVPPRR